MKTPVLEPPPVETGPPPPIPPRDHGNGGQGGNGEPPGRPRRAPSSVAVLGMWVALAPILMLFLAFVSAYVVRHGVGGGWTPGPMPRILWLNTVILAASSLVLERARRVDREGGAARSWIWGVLALGIAFVVGQVMAWLELRAIGVGIATTPHSSFFYLLTAAHALHVAGGLIGLGVVAAWPVRGLKGLGLATALQVVAIYWHFLFVLWIMLFAVLEIWR